MRAGWSVASLMLCRLPLIKNANSGGSWAVEQLEKLEEATAGGAESEFAAECRLRVALQWRALPGRGIDEGRAAMMVVDDEA